MSAGYHDPSEGKSMKTKNALLRKITAVSQSKWVWPALMAVVLFSNVLVLTGCTSPHH